MSTPMPFAAAFAIAGSAALDNGRRQWTSREMDEAATALAQLLGSHQVKVFATLMDNSPAWVIADLAALRAQVTHVPLPVFFTPEQVAHALRASGVDALMTLPHVAAQWPQAAAHPCPVAGESLVLVRLPGTPPPMPAGTAKITFTSGTTGTPKGVCLGAGAMNAVAAGLVQAMAPMGIRRHLCALPFAVLLENIAGLMAPLSHGATCIVLPLADIGLSGSSGFDAARFQQAVVQHQPDSIIMLPQMLRMWTGWLTHAGQRAPPCLKFVAVGGAAVGARLIMASRAQGIPAYEGYGLSEGASVQSLNLPGADLPGSAGRALPHAQLRVNADGEIEVAGSLFAGYLGDTQAAPEWWPTGDLGSIALQGFVHVQGRRKHVLITAFGRNVSPEWVEGALQAESGIAQAVVLGDGEPALSAVLWPVHPATTDASLHAAVEAANNTLPDYARIANWVRATAPFTAASGMATANGRPQRAAILAAHTSALASALASTDTHTISPEYS